MKMKMGIRYMRYSSKGQSNSSIERQELYTGDWFTRNEVTLIDSFKDEGHTARTFDRPDFKKLDAFIKRHHRQVDYLVVDQLDRFSRDAGEAITMVKQLQKRYSIQIVSVVEGLVFDYNTPGSFFRAGLHFLLAEDDNINRMHKINAGIYTAKMVDGRYIGSKAPFGYAKEGTGKNRHLVIVAAEAAVVKFIFDAYLKNTPPYIIAQQAKQQGLHKTGNGLIHKILQNPVYIGQQIVRPFKDKPGGLCPINNHTPIIDAYTFNQVQQKLGGKVMRTQVNEQFPLRAVLKCHCGRALTGAPSTGKYKTYNYYKCQTSSKHNNFNADKAHSQLLQVLEHMSLQPYQVQFIRTKAQSILKERQQANSQQLQKLEKELKQQEQQLISVEEKYINNQLSFESYQRWYSQSVSQRSNLTAQVEVLSRDGQHVQALLDHNLERLGNLQGFYSMASITEKQELIRLVFDNQLYYKEGVYRTPYMMPVFTHSVMIMKEKRLLILDTYEQSANEVDPTSPLSNSLTSLLTFLGSLKAA